MTRIALLALSLSACGGGGHAPGTEPPDGTTQSFADGGALPPPPQATSAVLTWHNDALRTGATLTERILTPDAIRDHGMRLRVTRPVNKAAYAQVLYVPALEVDGQARNVFFAATLGNTVYAYDADDATATGSEAGLLWKRSLADPEDAAARPYARGIASTPVIDVEVGRLYVTFSTKDVLDEPWGESQVNAAFWIAALDLVTGEVVRTAKVEGSITRGDGSTLAFLARNHRNRPALLLADGSLYLAFGARSKEGMIEYHGWVFRYAAATLTRQGVWNATPDFIGVGQGGGIWGGGAGLAADPSGSVYLTTGNAEANAQAGTYGNSFVRLTPGPDHLAVAGSFSPPDPERNLERNDVNLGSGGLTLVPGTRQLVGGGKTGILYLLDLDGLAFVQELQAFTNIYHPDFVLDSNWAGGPHLHGGPVFWQGPDPDVGYVYHWAENDYLRAFRYLRSQGRLNPDPIVGRILAIADIMPGGMLSLSANGRDDAVLWAMLPASDAPDPTFGEYPGRLIAFDALTLDVLWEGEFPTLSKWMPPTIADGKAFVPTSSKEIEVWELGP